MSSSNIVGLDLGTSSVRALRGASMLAAEQMGLLSSIDDVPVELGRTVAPKEERLPIYGQMFERDSNLFEALYEKASLFEHPHSTSLIGAFSG